jgi:hypothetical protein
MTRLSSAALRSTSAKVRRSESDEVPKGAVRRSKAQPNPARCRVHSDAEALALALRRAIKVV